MQDKSFEATALKAAIAAAKSTSAPALAAPAAEPPAATSAPASAVAPDAAVSAAAPLAAQARALQFQGDPIRPADVVNADALNAIVRIRNWSYVSAPHPSTMVDPGLPGHSFWAVVIIGQPVGIIHDVKTLIDILMEQTEAWFIICDSFLEALGTYKTHFSNGRVRITPIMRTSMTTLLPGSSINPIFVSSAAPTPARPRRNKAPSKPRSTRSSKKTKKAATPPPDIDTDDMFLPDTPPEAAPQAAQEADDEDRRSDAMHVDDDDEANAVQAPHSPAVSVSSHDAPPAEDLGAQQEVEQGPVDKKGKGKLAVRVVTDLIDPALRHIPRYPSTRSTPGATQSGPSMPLASSPFSVPTHAGPGPVQRQSFLSADGDDSNPFISTPVVTRSKKRSQHSDKDPKSSSTMNDDPVAKKKKRLEAVEAAFANSASSAAASTSGTSHSISQMASGSQQGQPAPDPYDLISDSESDFSGITDWTAQELDAFGPVLGGHANTASTSQAPSAIATASTSQVRSAIASATPPPSVTKPRTRAASRK